MEDHTYKIKSEVVLKEEDGEGILFDPETCATHFLNESAIFIWKALINGKDRSQIIQEMLERYDKVDEETVARDLDDTITRLQQSGFIIEKNET